MRPSLRSPLSAALSAAIVIFFFLLLPRIARAQDNSRQSSSPSTTPSSQKQLPRQATVITNETINLPRPPRPPRPTAPPAPQPAPLVQTAPPAPAEDAAAKAAEIASLQKQIKDKQKRIELLMHLFATDERRFLQAPTDAQDDAAAQARVHSEQEELRAETAACARLQARLDALTTTPTRP